MEETPLEATPTFTPAPRKINKRFIYLVLAIIVLGLLFLSYKLFGSKNNSNISTSIQTTPVQTPTDTPTPTIEVSPTETNTTPTPTPKPTINPIDKTSGLDRSKLSVTIENGSGEAGVAGKASDILKNLGYNVTGTQNADNFNYQNVSIQIKSSQKDYLALLQKDLGFSYTVGSASSDLSDGFSSDALVIIGK